ncbi:MAG: excinuclease ABC subunit A [Methanobacteriota archaeon]|nr:MAG: excinuclease ABC subunit A [Euryarchaeota archaeon]|tara:strand:- start:15158 stop:18019 length:2862 start_codon:yes stop_codon:yes gene_type:complete
MSPKPKSDERVIVIKGARTHNLKNIDVEIPRGKFVVVSGVSGSGKSSLAFDTLYAEGQRRYVESLSSYARQFLGQMKKADCDSIEGLSPAISIDQKQGSHNPRSTVSTVTEIMDYLRLIWARIGKPHCPECGKKVSIQTIQEIVDDILWKFNDKAIAVWSPTIRNRKGTHADLFRQMVENGFLVGKVNGREASFDNPPLLEKNLRHDIDIRIDRIKLTTKNRQRLTEAIETGLKFGGGSVGIEDLELGKNNISTYSEEFACPDHGAFLPEMSPRIFSFNSPLGACPDCQGLGVQKKLSLELVVDENLSIVDGCIRPFQRSMSASWYRAVMAQTAIHYGYDPTIPFKEFDEQGKNIILYGTGSVNIDFNIKGRKGKSNYTMRKPWEGVVSRIERQYRETEYDGTRNRISSFMVDFPCDACNGEQLNNAARLVTIGNITLPQLSTSTVLDAIKIVSSWLDSGVLSERELHIANDALLEIHSRLKFLSDVGLGYLTLNRKANTLSGGESQRIRLATQIGSRLTGVMYVLDEPSIGLHQRDNAKLISTLRELVDLGNTLIVVEHDEETLLQADYLIDLGPGAGRKGGEVVIAGTPKQVMKCKKSVTGQYLSQVKHIPIPSFRTSPKEKYLLILGASENNLKDINVCIPLGCMISITGVSGSGKSSLISRILAPVLLRDVQKADTSPGNHTAIQGIEHVDKAIVIDQSPIGRTPRSNPATYTKSFDIIRKIFSETKLSKERGYTPGHFSFNVRGGRCEACKGAGSSKLEMNFLPDVWVTCDSCKGKKYTRETLEVEWKGKNIFDILEMTVNEATNFFENHKKLHIILKTLNDVGLGYIRLGQAATTLSGGEAQRVKLASELRKPPNSHTVYILDEPTTGLSISDVRQLIEVLHKLRDQGHTVIIIEHHLDIIKTSDWIIDLGPEGGMDGGEIVAEGTPEDVAKNLNSHTGASLREVLN